MAELTTEYMGITLRNPILIASSSLTRDTEGIVKLEKNGAGGVVLKSLFEEQVKTEVADELEGQVGPSWHTEAYDYVSKMGMTFGPSENLKLIEEAKKAVSIPVIASLNCVSTVWWKDYAKQIEAAGADGIELNVSYLVNDVKRDGREVENLYFKILDKVKSSLSIPVAVKIGPFFTSLGSFANELCRRGADALVLFNRFYQFDIDIDGRKVTAGNPLSVPAETNLPLRWIALLSKRVNCHLSATTGIHTGKDAIKHILAGARTVQLCSTVYKKGPEQIGAVLEEIERWMKDQKIDRLDGVRGILSQDESDKPELYERLQYIKALVGIE
jgi:dihydroorotate dehydrogenase (fumarate)